MEPNSTCIQMKELPNQAPSITQCLTYRIEWDSLVWLQHLHNSTPAILRIQPGYLSKVNFTPHKHYCPDNHPTVLCNDSPQCIGERYKFSTVIAPSLSPKAIQAPPTKSATLPKGLMYYMLSHSTIILLIPVQHGTQFQIFFCIQLTT